MLWPETLSVWRREVGQVMVSEPTAVRRATVDDIPFLSAMMDEAYLASPTFLAHHSMEQVQRYEERLWAEWRDHPGPAFIAVESDGRPLGALRLTPDDSPHGQGWVIGIGVAAGARRQGVGRRLMEAAITFARTTGAPYLYLVVDPTNAPAIALYRHTGFIETGEVEHALGMRLVLDQPTP